MLSSVYLLSILFYLPPCSIAASIERRDNLPIVDLGYERHQAISFNESSGLYNFSNIRYAQPPIGDLRFRAPLAPEGKSSTINNGSIGRTCPQASGSWTQIAKLFALSQTLGSTFNYTQALSTLPGPTVPGSVEYDERTTEDCLFLDVYVPSGVFDASITGLPVLVWLHGGGYTSGEKNGDGQFDPTALLAAQHNSLIFIAINYRLGAFGWLAGSTLQQNSSGTANAGLYDQALAFRWVRDHIALFGGDPARVTVMGKSSGAGSLMHHVTAFGGDAARAPDFSQAIITSPAFLPQPNEDAAEGVLQSFLKALNVSTLAEARALPSDALIRANAVVVANSTYGSNSFGPVVDGAFVPDLPGKLLLEGRFHNRSSSGGGGSSASADGDEGQQIVLAVSHNLNEALTFTDPRLNSSSSSSSDSNSSSLTYTDFLRQAFPDISDEAAAYVADTLYPPVFDGSEGYNDGFQRAVKTVADAAFRCNAYYLSAAFAGAGYAWEFSVPPGIHGQDTSYIFPAATGGSGALLGLNQTVATVLRDYIASFAVDGVPSAAEGGGGIPLYGEEKRIVNMTARGIGVMRDDAANERCVWWQKEEYVGKAAASGGGDGGEDGQNGTTGGGDGQKGGASARDLLDGGTTGSLVLLSIAILLIL